MLRFDLMFELKGGDDGQGSHSDDNDTMRSCFLVPAMLTDSIDTFPQYSAAAAAAGRAGAPQRQAPLRCFFVFEEESSAITAPMSGRGSNSSMNGLLPAVVFAGQAKCACWAQGTSSIEPRLCKPRRSDIRIAALRAAARSETCTTSPCCESTHGRRRWCQAEADGG